MTLQPTFIAVKHPNFYVMGQNSPFYSAVKLIILLLENLNELDQLIRSALIDHKPVHFLTISQQKWNSVNHNKLG